MAWIRRGPHRYYSRYERAGKAVRRVNFGRGGIAQLAADLDALNGLARREGARAWRDERARHEAAGALMVELGNVAGMLVEVALTKAGYHRHDRGPWRRRRMMPDAVESTNEPLTPERVREVLEAARMGDRSALPMLRKVLDAHPEIWQALGDLAAHAQRALVDLAAGPDLALGESLVRKLAALKAELAGPSPSSLEKLLVDRIAACWVQVHHADAMVGQAKGRDPSLAQLDHLERRMARAQKSYLAAIRALATIRRLLPSTPKAPAAAVAGRTVETVRRDAKKAHRVERAMEVDKGPEANKKGHVQHPSAGRRKKPQGSAVPEALRARMRGLVASEN